MNITAMSGILFYSLSYFVKQYIDKQEKINRLLEIESKARKELQTKTQNLESVLSEKEILLKEIHHRVKNNMQIIASLIALQVKNLESPTTIHEFQQIRNRINSMAIVHEMLYQSEDLSQIDYGDYVEKLALGLLASMKGDDSNVTYAFNVDHIKVNIDTAIPLGLLINELLTNALKYAFPNGQEGEVHLSIKQVSDAYELIISDNGVGFSFDGDFDKLRTLGMRLVYSLVEQLEGTIAQENRNGTSYFITFKNIDSSN
jgi:two-component sensor histidine kinase